MGSPSNNRLKLPAIYLFSGYFKNNKLSSKLSPISNALVSSESEIWRTDDTGTIRGLSVDGKSLQVLRSSVTELVVYLPPVDFLSLLSGTDSEWVKNASKFIEQISLSKSYEVGKLHKVAPDQLVTPSKNNDSYSALYSRLKKEKKDLHAYVVAKTRILVVMIRKSIPINLASKLKCFLPDQKEYISIDWKIDSALENEDFYFAIISDRNSNLTEGLYRFEIFLDILKLGSQKWNEGIISSNVDSNGRSVPSYTLSHWAKFDVTNSAGEFEIVNADPITVEEALIKQYPRSYGHLLSAANDIKNKGVVTDPTKPLRDQHQTNTKKIGDAGGKVAQGFIDYATSWSVMKEKSQLAAKLTSIDLSERIGSDGKVYNGKKSLSWAIGKALHAHLQTSEDEKIRYTLDMAFSTKDGVDAWGTFRKSLADLNEPNLPSAREALKKNYFELPNNTQEDLDKYANSIAGKLGVPKVGLDLFNKTMALVDLASNLNAISKDGYSYFTEVIPDLKTAKTNFEKIAQDYFETVGEKTESKAYQLYNLFQFDSAQLHPKSYEIIAECAPKIIKSLELAPETKVIVAGHTCDIGTPQYNQKLSLDRANAIKDALVKAGVSETSLVVEGLGEEQPLVENTSEENRAKNRRVEIAFNSTIYQKVSPCREGIDTLERYRNITIQRELNANEKEIALAIQATDIAVGLLMAIPAAAPFAAAYLLAKSAGTVLMSAGKWLDEVCMDNAFAQMSLDRKRDDILTKESAANINMLREHFDDYDKEDSAPAPVQWAAQYRMRAEALSGLLALLQRAAISEDGQEAYIQRLEKYQVQAYIENFILGDGWVIPRNEVSMLRMDTFWLYAINDKMREKLSNYDVRKVVNFGLDKNNRLLSQQDREEVKQLAESRMKRAHKYLGSGDNPRGAYYMARAAYRRGHITAKFHNFFPIHTLASTKFEKGKEVLDLEGFGHTFNPVFANYQPSDYAFCCVYYRPEYHSEEWVPYYQTLKKRRVGRSFRWEYPEVGPFTPFRVLVVFNEDCTGILPISVNVDRTDGVDVSGPRYKLEAKALTAGELLPSEQQFVNRVGFVFYPFFQLGQKTFLGLKPMAGETAIGLMGAENYYKFGNLSDMRYQLTCEIADNVDSKVDLPLFFDQEKNPLSRINHNHMRSIAMDVDIKRPTSEGVVLFDDFLISDTKEFDYPTLYEGDLRVRFGVRIGEDSPYILPEVKGWSGYRIFKGEIQATQRNVSGLKITTDQDDIEISGFDWNTPVEFAFIATCTQLNKENYKKADVSWKKIPCKVKMFEDAGMLDLIPQEGPEFATSLVYLGRATRNTAAQRSDDGFDFEPSDLSDKDLLPLQEMLKQKDNKARAIVGWYKSIADLKLERYVFAAVVQCKYQSPKGVTVNSLRPFGDDVFQSEYDFEDTIRFVFKEFKSAGNSGFNTDVQYEQTVYDYGITFNAPKSYSHNAPWTKPLSSEELERLKPKMNENAYKAISSNHLADSEVKQWLEDESKNLNWSPLWAIDKH